MVLKRLLGSRASKSLAVVSVLKEAKTALDRGKRTRAIVLLGVAVLAWKWTVIGLAAQGVLKLLRKGRGGGTSSSPA